MNTDKFDSEMAMKNIGALKLRKFIEFLQEVGDYLPSIVLIGLRRNWMKENPDEKNHEIAILGADFESVSNEDKLEFYDEVMDKLDAKLGKRVYRHMFPVGSITAIKSKKQMKSQTATFHSSKNLKQRKEKRLKRQNYMSSDDGSSSEVPDASRPKVANTMPTISLLSESEE